MKADTDVGSITWIELFVLFDTTRYRSEEGQHIKNKAAAKRAEERKGRERMERKCVFVGVGRGNCYHPYVQFASEKQT